MANNRLIAKNTVALYLRTIVTVIVSLYTSRVVLEEPGVEDYGIYNVVGGTIAMMTFLNAAMSGASSRFITYEMGKGPESRLREAFGTAMAIHAVIAVIVLLLAETLGLWFVNTQLVIPESRMFAANIVYQTAVATAVLGVLQTPLQALVMSYERFTFYAYLEIFTAVSKLGIAFLLIVVASDKLILYAWLTLLIMAVVFVLYIVYCRYNFSNVLKGRVRSDRSFVRAMLSFLGWGIVGNVSVIVNFQGCGIAMNMIYGAAVNAAYGIANIVQGTLKGLALNIVAASRPQIIMSYSKGNLTEMFALMRNATNIGLVMYLMTALPVYFNAQTVLGIWLLEVPPHTVAFLKIVLLGGVFSVCNQPIYIAIHATGRIRSSSVYPGIVYLSAPFVFYAIMKMGVPVDTAFYIIVATYSICLLICLLIVKNLIPEIRLTRFMLRSYLAVVPAVIAVEAILFAVGIEQIYFKLVASIVVTVAVLAAYYFYFCLDRAQRRSLKTMLLKRLKN